MARIACKILMVDDSDDDRALFRIAVKKAGPAMQILEPISDGEQAIAYLAGRDQYSDRALFPYPELLLLDLKMPGKSGFDVLEWLNDQDTRPVTVVLSGSDQQRDINKAFELGANFYHVKPSELNEWVTTVRAIEGYAQREPVRT